MNNTREKQSIEVIPTLGSQQTYRCSAISPGKTAPRVGEFGSGVVLNCSKFIFKLNKLRSKASHVVAVDAKSWTKMLKVDGS